MSQPTTTAAAEKPWTPNDGFRRVRKIYLICISLALPLLFLALLATIHKVGHGILAVLLLIAGVALLIVAMMMRAAAGCPRCSTSLLWRSGPIGMGRLSLMQKKKCPGCDLDLDQPWSPPPESEAKAG